MISDIPSTGFQRGQYDHESPRICLLSARQVRNRVSDAAIYELEDAIASFAPTDLIAYTQAPDWPRRVYTLASQFTRSPRLARLITPKPQSAMTLQQDYDLFVVIFRNIFEILALDALTNWRQRCRQAVCVIVESWNNPQWLGQRKYLLEPLKQFDQIFVGSQASLATIADVTHRPCHHLLFGVNALRFCPYPQLPERSIDLASLGRRSEVTHQALLALAEAGEMFYYYDTASNLRTMNAREHRLMYANLLKRSRYFIVNYACIDEPEKTKGAFEIGYRFFEGAAAGTVMIGCPPPTAEFQTQFDWPDAVIPMPFDMPQIGQFLADLDQQGERLARIRIANMVNALVRHDWVYRWREVLTALGRVETPEMRRRQAYLHSLAQEIQLTTNSAGCRVA